MKHNKRELLAEYKKRKALRPLNYYKRMPQQQKFADDPNKIKILFGGNRSGKSEEGGAYVTGKLESSTCRWWASGITFKDSINIQQRKVNTYISAGKRLSGPYNMQTGFSGQSVIVRAKDEGKSKLDFKSTISGPDKYQGDDLDGIWLDEEHPISIVNECKMRLLDRDGELIITMTSLKGMTPFIEEFWDGCEIVETRYAEYLDEYVPVVAKKNGVSFYFLWTTDNPHIDQKRLRNEIKSMTRNEIKSRIYGIPVNLAGVMYPQFSSDVHIWDKRQIPKREKFSVYTVLDPHDRKPWAIAWFLVHKTGASFCVDEFPRVKFKEYYQHHTYEEYAKIIKETEQYLCREFYQPRVSGRFIDPNFGNKTAQKVVRDGGSSMTTPKAELAKLGLTFKDSQDNLRIGHMAVQRALSWAEKDGQMVKAPKTFVTDNCVNMIEAYKRYACKENGQPEDAYKDFADLTRYFHVMNPQFVDEAKIIAELNRANNDYKRLY